MKYPNGISHGNIDWEKERGDVWLAKQQKKETKMEFELFKESDADHLSSYYKLKYISLDKANRIFRDWLAKGTRVTASSAGSTMWRTEDYFKGLSFNEDTHRAVLVCIEEIEKEKPLIDVQEIKALGLSAEQIKHCKIFYENATGVRAEFINKETDGKQKLMQDLKNYLDETFFEELHTNTAESLLERAKKILEKDEYEERDRQRK